METVKINMVPKGAVKAAHASQGDAPRVVRFELFDELLPYTLDGSEDITLKVVRPDTEEIVSSVTNTEEAYIDVSFTSEMTAIRGVANCEINISKNGADLGSHNFDLNIERDAYGEDITVETASGVIATFTTGVIDNLVGLKTTFEPKQDLHGYETPWIDSNVVNKAPYLSRALSGTASRIGNYEFNRLVGGTYAFNQLCEHGNFDSLSGWDKTRGNLSISNNILTYTITEVGSDTNANRISRYIYKGANHKVLVSFDMLSAVNAFGGIRLVNSQVSKLDIPVSANIWTRISTIFSASGDNENLWLGFGQMNAQIGDEVKVKNVIVIDLTQMLGSTIADYIYSLETAQAGAGVSFFKALFDKDYYPYNAGELMSVKTSAHITRDENNTVISNTALDPDIELRGIPKLDENNKLYYDGDTYESNGDVTRNMRLFDCANEAFDMRKNASSDNTDWLYYFTRYDISDDSDPTDIISHVFEAVDFAPARQNGKKCNLNKQYHVIYMNMYGLISTNDVETAKQWLIDNAVKFLYKKTPTTESADPFTDPQEIDASGSEEFIDARAVSIPVGHESYYANICEIEGIDEITFYHSGEDTQDPESALVEIGQEVYGGYYDKDLGIVLTNKLVDLGSYTWFKVGMGDGRQGFRATFDDMELTPASNIPINALCSVYPILNGNQVYLGNIGLAGWGADTQAVAIYDPLHESDTINEFKAFVNGIKVCYKLADPIIIPADAVNFETVKGVNNVWSDTNGETEVKFFVKES